MTASDRTTAGMADAMRPTTGGQARHRGTPKSENDGVDPSIVERARRWSDMDEDLIDVPEDLARSIFDARCAMASSDVPRTPLWRDPDGVDVLTDIPYLPDGDSVRGHRLDLYLPQDAVLRGGHTTPVFIDVHGGAFCYGSKELNRNFATHLCALGFGVIGLNYRVAPQTDLRGQLADIQAGLRWVKTHAEEHPLDPSTVFLTGDSAGAALALLTLAIESSSDAARAFGIRRASELRLSGAALVSGVYDLSRNGAPGTGRHRTYTSLKGTVGEAFFAGLDDAQRWLTPQGLVRSAQLPPLFLTTSSDDFLESETLDLAAALARRHADFELHDWKAPRHQTLGHVFPVCLTWLEESRRALDLMRDFALSRA
ncbi:alpha/beta hydrolase [uncultured Bifidobacterium sp.]|uniref:alpha/beta hydrolase n=1 Tax=uncultured Bifidobacterium sp. TaxID=165187 RepID=UPI0028DB9F81|nr:alpha/beta hydrolase [uncultured Bifidobacterium sp.]